MLKTHLCLTATPCFLMESVNLVGSHSAWAAPIPIRHIVVFGNAFSDNGNTSALFDELAGRKYPTRLREDIRFHDPDIVDAASSTLISAAPLTGVRYLQWHAHLDKIPYIKDHAILSQAACVSLLATLLYRTGLAHWLAKPVDLIIDRREMLLKAMLWLYPSIGMPVLPPGQLYDKGGRFTNGDRVWVELLAERMGLNPDNRTDFLSLTYAGSHVGEGLSGQDILSFNIWLDYISLGMNFIDTLIHKKPSSNESFWDLAAHNMTKERLERFENFLKNDIPPSLKYTTESYNDKNHYNEKRDPEATLYIIVYGADDYIVDDAKPADVIEALRDGMEKLIIRDHARHFVISHLSYLDQLPAMKRLGIERAGKIQDKTCEHNMKLDQMMAELNQKYPEVILTPISGGSKLLERAKQENLSLGPCLTIANRNSSDENSSTLHVPGMDKHTIFTDDIIKSGSSLQAAYRFLGRTIQKCNQPDNYLFYDDFNLTSRGHQLASELMCKHLAENGYLCK